MSEKESILAKLAAKPEVDTGPKEYPVQITETLQMTVWMEANSPDEAIALVRAAYKDTEYVLDADHFTGVEFKVTGNEHKRDAPEH